MGGTTPAPARERLAADPEWEAIIRAHSHAVRISLLAIGVRLERADELTQAAWARLIEKERSGGLAERRFPGLAIAQARFLALDERRREKRLRTEELEQLETVVDPAAQSPELRLIEKERLERALTAIAGCSPSAQEVFRLIYQEPGLPHAEVAARLELSVQRVRQILCEVRKKVRRAVEEER
jgi:RNA polymerase sigma-70 factor (ECF subfamily)